MTLTTVFHAPIRALASPFMLLLLALPLSACAPQRIREASVLHMRVGNFETAIAELQRGLQTYPDNTALRSSVLQAKAEAVSRLLARAGRERSDGKLGDAELTLKRATTVDPDHPRVAALLADIANDRRANSYLAEAQRAQTVADNSGALKWVAQGLMYAPQHPALTAMKRQLESQVNGLIVSRFMDLQSADAIVTLEFRATPLTVVLDALSRSSGVNFVLDRDVRADSLITIHMKQARLIDILDVVLPAQQLARKIVDPKTVMVYPNTPEKQREHQEQVVRAFYLAHVEAKNTANLLRSVLKIKEPFVDERSNLLVIRESPEMVQLAEKLVVLHDLSEPEVMLEVEVLEVKTTRLKELGIQFPSTFSLTPLATSGAGAGTSALTVAGLRNVNASQVGVSVAGLVLNLRREVGDFNTLANPRIRARNKEKAKIMIGDKVPVITTTVGANGLITENVNYIDVGLKFEVEPSVSPEDQVLIKLGLEVSTIVSQIRSAGGSTAYQIGTRNATTALRLKDGETQILGGLISKNDRTTANRIPGLGDLPLAGRLFGSQLDDYQETELILAITPRILRSAPHPTADQAELWIGPEYHTRLKSPRGLAQPVQNQPSADQTNIPADLPAALPGSPSIDWQRPESVTVGQSFWIQVRLETGTAIQGTPMEIAYSSALLEVVRVVEGDFFKQAGVATSFVNSVNPETGRIHVGLLGQRTAGANGKGSLVLVEFKAKAVGEAELGFASLQLLGTPSVYDIPSTRVAVK